MAQTLVADPLAKTWGLVPRYLRERQAAEAFARANPPQLAPAPEPDELLTGPRAMDAVTADLRRRVAVAPSRSSVALMIGMLTRH